MTRRDLRVTVPMNAKELRMVHKAAKVVGEKPSVFARDAIKRVSRAVLKSAGVQVRLGMDDFGAGTALEGQEEAQEG